MRTVRFTEFRNNASYLLTEVEKGETIKILRHNKIIAEIRPASDYTSQIPAWKKNGLKIIAKGKSLSSAILEERAEN